MSSAPADYAVVDLGTNTFHLLVGRFEHGRLVEVDRERHFVKVASDGIERIGDAPCARAEAAAAAIGARLRSHTCAGALAFGTAALRTASNGPELRDRLAAKLGVPIQLIDGRREAQLIATGVLAAGLPPRGRHLIVDIGGGSTEFIFVTDGKVGFRESYPVGAQVLRTRFHTAEPFAAGDQETRLRAHLADVLAPVLRELGDDSGAGGLETAPVTIVGASGTFDVLGDLFGTPREGVLRSFDAARVRALYAEARRMGEGERLGDPRLPVDRADMIVVALGLIDFLLGHNVFEGILACEYALKEGALYELSAAPT